MPTTTNYIWDEQNYLAEADGSNVVQTVYTNEPQQYGNLVSTRISGTTSYHHFDAIGSTRQLTNAGGTVTDTVIYDAWGNAVNRTGATTVTRLFVGTLTYYYDVETGRIWVLARPYDAAIGRWTTVDPAGFADGLAIYCYVGNAPVLAIDPSGLRCCKLTSFIIHREGACSFKRGFAEGSAGSSFDVFATFASPCCRRCEYRQKVRGYQREREYEAGSSPPDNWTYIASMPGFVEDAVRGARYGHRSDEPRFYNPDTGFAPKLAEYPAAIDAYSHNQAFGCTYKGFDRPGFILLNSELETLQIVADLTHTKPHIVEYEMSLDFEHLIIDNEPFPILDPTVARKYTHMECRFRLRGGKVAIVQPTGVIGAALPPDPYF